VATTGVRPTSSRALSRLRLEQSKLDDVSFIVADGLFEAAKLIIETASGLAPDSPYDPYPTGEGLPKQGGVLVYAGNRKTHGWSIRGDQPVKPRASRATTKGHSIVAVLGFGFPGRFAEAGTVNMAGKPFLAPSRDAVAPHIPEIVGDVTRPRLAGNR
jgi:hypothetical protein